MDKTNLMELEKVINSSNNNNNNSSTKDKLIDASDTDDSTISWQEEYAYTLGTQAYICAYSWLYFAQLRYRWLSRNKTYEYNGPDMPYNQFYHYKDLITPASNAEGTPNTDTLYSLCFLNLDKEPIVFSHPAIIDRYFSFEIASMTSDNFGYIGQRTTGKQEGHFLIAGPNWDGKLPKGLRSCDIIRYPEKSNGTRLMNLPVTSPTKYAFGLVRTEVRDGDVKTVHDIQKKYILTPLSQWVNNEDPNPIDGNTFKPYELRKEGSLEEWKTINRFMIDNPCLVQNKEFFKQFEQIGIGPGIMIEDLDESTKKGLIRAALEGKRLIKEMGKEGVGCSKKNGWSFPPREMGSAGYFQKFELRGAIQCAEGMISNDPEEAIYPNTTVDSDNKQLNGANRYTMTFREEEIPDVNAFWSLTLYGSDNKLVAKSKSYCFSSRNSYKLEPGGRLVIHIQAEKPSGAAINWLQSPKNKEFLMVLRAYLPGGDVLSSNWKIPGLVKQ
ncbi:DUF1254 domain-containing protein [Ancylomarina sp.]|uniref:DUF1254 domain-containing protein n=1 Tax=Ancylomarina sp. TaxID=1970196 RepID=UPI0035686A91